MSGLSTGETGRILDLWQAGDISMETNNSPHINSPDGHRLCGHIVRKFGRRTAPRFVDTFLGIRKVVTSEFWYECDCGMKWEGTRREMDAESGCVY